MSLTALEKSLFALQIVGLILLAMLFCTFKLSNTLDRNSLFMNFLITWLMYTAYTTFYAVTIISLPATSIAQFGVAIMGQTLLDFFSLVSIVATLNLIVHLWFKMRSVFTTERSPSVEKWLTPILLVSPYLIGVLCLAELFSDWGIIVFGYFFLSTMVITSLWDILLLTMFLFKHRVVRLAVQRGLLPISLLVRLLIFSLLRLAYFGVSLGRSLAGPRADANASGAAEAEVVIGSLIPISVFALFGLRQDVLQTWFPCLVSRKTTNQTLTMVISENEATSTSTRSLTLNDMESQVSGSDANKIESGVTLYLREEVI